MEKFKLSKEQFLNGRIYIPLEEKTAFIEENAPKCFDRLQISANDDAMPPMYMENTELKNRYLMYALTAMYLGLDVEHEDMLISKEDYDKYAGSAIYNQIVRFKAISELCNRVFDFQADYRDFEKRFGAQIHGLLEVQNDAVMRQSMMTKAEMAELPALLEELRKLGDKNGA